jgi:penicillin-binding protein 1A
MDTLLIKIFATALTFSQVATAPDAVKTQFDPVADAPAVIALLRAGCAQMRKAFDVEDINIDDLIATAMDDPDIIAGGPAAFKGISIRDLHVSYRQFCKNETVANSTFDVAAVIDFYNKTLAELPDHMRLKGLKLPGATFVLDGKGQRFAEVYEPDQRRIWVALNEIPAQVQKAFVAAEDKRFYQHKGVDERGMIRAFIGNLAQSGRPQGGSTITQQVIKNLLVGEDVTYERKMREMVLAARVERTLGKAEILELYLNSTYLGRGSWGIEMAARSYFGKSAAALTLREGALLAALTKGPNYFNPDRHPARAQERLVYVLGRMAEDGVITPEEAKQAQGAMPTFVAFERPRRDSGFHFTDHLAREAKTLAGIDALTADSYTVRSTIQPELQRATEAALQEGLARFELDGGRVQFQAAEANLADAVRRIEAERKPAAEKPAAERPAAGNPAPTLVPELAPQTTVLRTPAAKGSPKQQPGPKAAQKSAPDRAAPKPPPDKAEKPAWLAALEGARLPLYDVHWPVGVVLERSQRSGDGLRVGLADGRILPLSVARASIHRALRSYDVVFVRVADAKGKNPRAELRVRPQVQGAALVLENKTGRILAMSGGFSYPLSQLNRVTQSQRQPGSALKPLTYLAALQAGLQPNTLVRDAEITLRPMGGGRGREQDYWTPKNYDGGESGVVTLRRALENSKNLATVNLLEGGIEGDAERSFERICGLAMEAQVYKECVRYYPFVLGAQPVRPVDLAAFYAAIAMEGQRPAPYAIEAIEHRGKAVYRHGTDGTAQIGSADRVAFFQLKTMLQGVLARGTARAYSNLAPYVAGKTGTTDGENDAWFVGFTNDVTVAVWVGYDNADGRRRTLGGGQTGASVALPIFEPIIQAVWSSYAPKTALNPPSPETRRLLVTRPIDLNSGDALSAGGRGFVEYFRRERGGEAADTQFRLVSRADAYVGNAMRDEDDDRRFDENRRLFPGGQPPPLVRDPWRQGPWDNRPQVQPPPQQRPQQTPWGGFFGDWRR